MRQYVISTATPLGRFRQRRGSDDVCSRGCGAVCLPVSEDPLTQAFLLASPRTVGGRPPSESSAADRGHPLGAGHGRPAPMLPNSQQVQSRE